jgi:hypothetical protein
VEKISDRLLNWASILEPTTRLQAERTASMPFINPHMALMPDAHLGKGATVGSVIPTDGAIIPAAVGVDIGCGVNAVRTQFTGDDLRGRNLSVLHEQISRAIPLSAGRYNKKLRDSAAARVAELRDLPGAAQADGVAHNWPMQLGSLGSGNHFIEVSLDEADRVWLFLHSGSRGVGNKLASIHIRRAQEWCRAQGISLPERDLAYLQEGTPEFDAYIEALRWAQRFAYLNREEMMDRVVDQTGRFLGTEVERAEVINLRARGAVGADPGLDGDGVLRRRRQGERAVADVLAARRRAEPLPDGGASAFHAEGPRRADGRHRVGPLGRVPRRAPRRLQAGGPGDGRRGRPGGGAAHAAPGGQRQGQLIAGPAFPRERRTGARRTGAVMRSAARCDCCAHVAAQADAALPSRP